ncbi:chromophore lyase CpcT/CpeT [Spirulina sp. CS-785/01]|uniref:chromophore lyase CpcT/CpeT n=1 Tax=Spirulina sp. CS-785/01 TaxID=3021716 RepID=UPI0023314E3B|nr:chromophore lyase CpcT/CpeT [Spirulina sp. CS-785/01]MDB9314914.1 chromophore lyase CpcT/CpeT [Spirulina sp. CS-785/01]
MSLSPELLTLGQYFAGEFTNQQQALADPAWYVNLCLWHRPVPLFTHDSLTFYAEQANVHKRHQPYRPRLLRLRQTQSTPLSLQVEYYQFHDIDWVKGAGQNPDILTQLTPENVKPLSGCTLPLEVRSTESGELSFHTLNPTRQPCSFNYQGNEYQVFLGFVATAQNLQVYDKGINPQTGQALWGALMGPYRFSKTQDFTADLPIS